MLQIEEHDSKFAQVHSERRAIHLPSGNSNKISLVDQASFVSLQRKFSRLMASCVYERWPNNPSRKSSVENEHSNAKSEQSPMATRCHCSMMYRHVLETFYYKSSVTSSRDGAIEAHVVVVVSKIFFDGWSDSVQQNTTVRASLSSIFYFFNCIDRRSTAS